MSESEKPVSEHPLPEPPLAEQLPRSLWVLALGNFAVGTSGLVIAGVLGLMASSLKVGLGQAGAVVTVYALAYALSAPLLGGLTAHLPRKTLLLWAVLLFTLGNLGAALAPNLSMLLLARVVSAIGASLFTPVASGVASALVSPQVRGRALALVFAGVPVATVLGVPLGTWIGGALGWRAAFWLVVGLSVLAFIGVAALVRPVTVARPTLAWHALLRRPELRRSLAVMLLLYVGQFVVYPYLAPMLHGMTGLGTSGVTVMLLIFGVAGLLGNAIGGRLTDFWSGPRTLQMGLGLTALALLLLPVMLPHAWAAGLSMLIWGVGCLLTNPPQQARVVELTPQAPGVALALNASSLYLGQALGSTLGGVFAGPHLLWLGPVGGVVVLLAFWLAAMPRRTPLNLPAERPA